MAANETIRLPVFVLIPNLYKFCLAAYLVLYYWRTGRNGQRQIPLCHAYVNLRVCNRYTLFTVRISMTLSRGEALAVFLPDKVAKNINLIT